MWNHHFYYFLRLSYSAFRSYSHSPDLLFPEPTLLSSPNSFLPHLAQLVLKKILGYVTCSWFIRGCTHRKLTPSKQLTPAKTSSPKHGTSSVGTCIAFVHALQLLWVCMCSCPAVSTEGAPWTHHFWPLNEWIENFTEDRNDKFDQWNWITYAIIGLQCIPCL